MSANTLHELVDGILNDPFNINEAQLRRAWPSLQKRARELLKKQWSLPEPGARPPSAADDPKWGRLLRDLKTAQKRIRRGIRENTIRTESTLEIVDAKNPQGKVQITRAAYRNRENIHGPTKGRVESRNRKVQTWLMNLLDDLDTSFKRGTPDISTEHLSVRTSHVTGQRVVPSSDNAESSAACPKTQPQEPAERDRSIQDKPRERYNRQGHRSQNDSGYSSGAEEVPTKIVRTEGLAAKNNIAEEGGVQKAKSRTLRDRSARNQSQAQKLQKKDSRGRQVEKRGHVPPIQRIPNPDACSSRRQAAVRQAQRKEGTRGGKHKRLVRLPPEYLETLKDLSDRAPKKQTPVPRRAPRMK